MLNLVNLLHWHATPAMAVPAGLLFTGPWSSVLLVLGAHSFLNRVRASVRSLGSKLSRTRPTHLLRPRTFHFAQQDPLSSSDKLDPALGIRTLETWSLERNLGEEDWGHPLELGPPPPRFLVSGPCISPRETSCALAGKDSLLLQMTSALTLLACGSRGQVFHRPAMSPSRA